MVEYVTEISLQYDERHENTAQETQRTRRPRRWQTVHICKQSRPSHNNTSIDIRVVLQSVVQSFTFIILDLKHDKED